MLEYGWGMVSGNIRAGGYSSELGWALKCVGRRRSTRARGVGESVRARIRVVGSYTVARHGGQMVIALRRLTMAVRFTTPWERRAENKTKLN